MQNKIQGVTWVVTSPGWGVWSQLAQQASEWHMRLGAGRSGRGQRDGSVPTQLHKNLLSSTLDLASWGLALLPHSSTRQVLLSCRCSTLAFPDIMTNRVDRKQRQLHSLHFALSSIGLCLSKNRQDLAPITSGPCLLLLQAFCCPHSLSPSVTQGLPALSLHISYNSFKNHLGSRRIGLGR